MARPGPIYLVPLAVLIVVASVVFFCFRGRMRCLPRASEYNASGPDLEAGRTFQPPNPNQQPMTEPQRNFPSKVGTLNDSL